MVSQEPRIQTRNLLTVIHFIVKVRERVMVRKGPSRTAITTNGADLIRRGDYVMQADLIRRGDYGDAG